MLLQSLSGLAAKALNEGRGDELLWVAVDNNDCEAWYADFLSCHGGVELRGNFDTWALVRRYRDLGFVKGYALYRRDRSSRKTGDLSSQMELSANVATSAAGILGAVLIEESLEPEARRLGLPLLLDARGKSAEWCFEHFSAKASRTLLGLQDPRKPGMRDLAIARNALVFYGTDETTGKAMRWLEPLSRILGWNGGDEFESTRLSSINSHVQTCTDWSWNLPLLMAGASFADTPRAPGFDPRRIDWSDKRDCVSFVLSDGDNNQWFQTTFFRGEPGWWGNASRGDIPFGWSVPFTNLAELSPQPLAYALRTATPNDHFVEWGGCGYFYPDLFASSRPDRWALLARHSADIWSAMQATGTRLVGFLVRECDSPDALKAYSTFAGQTDGLAAILVIQYDPYEGGLGKIFWVKDRRGVDIPVICARYSIWAGRPDSASSGTPAKIADLLSRRDGDKGEGPETRFDWVVVHAWSFFRQSSSNSPTAEELSEPELAQGRGQRGYSPAVWAAHRLPGWLHVVGPEELAWRLRMKHNPGQTKLFLAEDSAKLAPAFPGSLQHKK
jgi:hypothetical protein